MDELVLKSMARWPNVPAVYGWLRLDRRGRWRLVDRGRPGFDERLHGEGSPITNAQIVDFIGRNYASDDAGRWYWQNGPQRVFVDIDLAPWVLRVLGSGDAARLVTHTGEPVARVDAVSQGAAGDLFVATELGTGAVYDLDLPQLDTEFDETVADAPRLARVRLLGAWHAVRALAAEVPDGWERRPRPGSTPTGAPR